MTQPCGPLLLAALLLATAASADAADASALTSCKELLAQDPAGEKPVVCLYDLARGTGPFRADASARLEALQAEDPGNPWPPLYIAHLLWQVHEPEAQDRAERLYRHSATLAQRRHLADAEYFARGGLCRLLRDSGRLEQEEAEMEKAVEIARTSGSPRLLAEAAVLQARHWVVVGEFGRAYLVLRQAKDVVESTGSEVLHSRYLTTLVNAAQQTGHFQEARNACQRLIEDAERQGKLSSVAAGRYMMAGLRFDELTAMPTAAGRGEVVRLARMALDAARAAGDPSLEPPILWLLGFLSDPPETRELLARCSEIAATPNYKSFCRSALARRMAAAEPDLATEATQDALRWARESGDKLSWTNTWHDRIHVSWAIHPPDAAFKESETALDAIEAFRDQQEGSASQPGLFSTWAEDYYWLSGRLLTGGDVERAFGVIERMRARTLTDALGLSRQKPSLSPALQARRYDLFLDITQVQRRLLQGDPSSREWAQAKAELGQLENRLEELQALARGSSAGPSRPRFASLEQIRRSLAADEALLSFQIAPARDLLGDFGGGAWLVVSTRSATRVYPLPDRVELRPKVYSFLGMFEARDGSEAPAAATLYRMLLERALAGLPPGIRRLVIVPDDALHRLPFAALRPAPSAEPLAVRYEISTVTSATLWLRWRQERTAKAAAPALVLADPPPTKPGTAAERAAAFAGETELGELPFAREEGRSVVHHLGGESLLLLGNEASEAALKQIDPGRFAIYHFATHSFTDDVEPDRSYVYLAPGSPQQDGFLQAREIVDLPFHGRIVVLSSCESASGEILRGEGVMGLARAFFRAEAPTVVASLWKLRDDEAAALFDRFYEHIAEGKSVSAALQAAQRDRMEAEAPAAAWAGVVVLGDGNRVPLPGGRKDHGRALMILLAVGGLAAAGAALLLLRRRSGSPA